MKYRIVKQEDGRYRVEPGYPLFPTVDSGIYWSLALHKGIFDTLAEAEARVKKLRKIAPQVIEEVIRVYED